MTQILDALFKVYEARVPDVRKITRAMIDKKMVKDQSDIINDHIADLVPGLAEGMDGMWFIDACQSSSVADAAWVLR